MTLSSRTQAEVRAAGLDPAELEQSLRHALDEDFRWGPDVTSRATVATDTRGAADVVARASGVFCGEPVARALFELQGFDAAGVCVHHRDGDVLTRGDRVLSVEGDLRAILGAERTLLNFLTHLSGVATGTRQWVDALAGTTCHVRDTRKTLPGLRQLQKYAVRCGGGKNHRFGLGDAALLKDNHVAAAGDLRRAVALLRKANLDVPVEVECDTLEQVREALAAGCSLILLDNMTLSEMAAAVALARNAGEVLFEASGGVTLQNARDIADVGVHFISVGALTHSVTTLDLALDFRPVTT